MTNEERKLYCKTFGERVKYYREAINITQSVLFARGMDLQAVSERLGHSDSKVTKEIYLHKLQELKEKENRQLDKIHIVG